MKSWIINVLKEIISRRAVNPFHGGEGEKERADYLEKLISGMGFDVERFDVTDNNGFVRSNLIVEYGDGEETIWLIAHIDTVSPGEGWKTDPFKLYVEGDRVYGRGVSDNGIGIMASLIILKKISEGTLSPNYRLKVGFLADEEAGSKYGLKYLIGKGVFKRGERAIVPDFGSEDGSVIEIAEKGILWLKFITHGEQTHGSRPDKGDNSFLKSMKFALELYEKLHKEFDEKDDFFEPPMSTFEPTKKETNVESINIIPGKDVHYWDCRILPRYEIDDVLNVVREVAKNFDTDVEVVMREDPSRVDPNDWIVKKLEQSIRNVLGVEPKLIGIGGGTFAGILRKAGVPSVVWNIRSGTEHKANEWEFLSNYVKTADVIADVITNR